MDMGRTYRQNGRQQVDHEVDKMDTSYTVDAHNRMRCRPTMRGRDIFQTQWERPASNNGIETLNSIKAEEEEEGIILSSIFRQ